MRVFVFVFIQLIDPPLLQTVQDVGHSYIVYSGHWCLSPAFIGQGGGVHSDGSQVHHKIQAQAHTLTPKGNLERPDNDGKFAGLFGEV